MSFAFPAVRRQSLISEQRVPGRGCCHRHQVVGSVHQRLGVARIARNTATEMAGVYISGDSAAEWAINGVPNSMMLEKPFAMAEMVTAVDQLLNDRLTDPASA